MLTDEQIENIYEDGYADREHDAVSVFGPSRGRLRAVAQEAADEAARSERRAIVEWLRKQADSNVPVQSGIERRMLALAIDSGEHLK